MFGTGTTVAGDLRLAIMNPVMAALVVIAMLITLGVLFTGLIAMARGGEFNRKYGNKLMRYRIMAQGLALLLFAIAMIGH